MERRSSYKIKLESFKLPRSVFSRLKISMILKEFLVVFFLQVAVVSWNGTTVVFLEGLLTLISI